MHTPFTPIPGTTYRLLEAIPYPRADRAGTLTDASGARLHGVYERKIAGGGYRTAVINNGGVFHRYTHERPSPPPIPGARNSYANLVLYEDSPAEGAADPCLERTLAARLDPC